MKKLIVRCVAVCLALVMILASAISVSAANDMSASTIRLESTEGTVTVKSAAGLAQTVREKMRLNNGYSVATGEKSYAYISLDTGRSLKLDASSEISISKSGKKLEVVLKSGSVFFDIENGLKTTESLNIRTSTMVTGIRGTVGVAKVLNPTTSTLMLLEGQVIVSNNSPYRIDTDAVYVTAGEIAQAVSTDAGDALSKVRFTEEEVPAFAAVVISESPSLQERIEEFTDLDPSKISEDASERLKEEQAAAEQDAQRAKEEAAEAEKDRNQGSFANVDPVFEPYVEDDYISDPVVNEEPSQEDPSGEQQDPSEEQEDPSEPRTIPVMIEMGQSTDYTISDGSEEKSYDAPQVSEICGNSEVRLLFTPKEDAAYEIVSVTGCYVDANGQEIPRVSSIELDFDGSMLYMPATSTIPEDAAQIKLYLNVEIQEKLIESQQSSQWVIDYTDLQSALNVPAIRQISLVNEYGKPAGYDVNGETLTIAADTALCCSEIICNTDAYIVVESGAELEAGLQIHGTLTINAGGSVRGAGISLNGTVNNSGVIEVNNISTPANDVTPVLNLYPGSKTYIQSPERNEDYSLKPMYGCSVIECEDKQGWYELVPEQTVIAPSQN